jgi:D-alanyl-D-alanine dipeptidase
MKPYKLLPIQECGEPLLPIATNCFAFVQPHPYAKLGAPYGDKSPFYVRARVLDRLMAAQHHLAHRQPGWQIQVFDAYRPLAVQQFMVDYSFAELLQQRGLIAENLTDNERETLIELVYEFWATPDDDPTRPPPHSTGGAIDVTLLDATGQPVNMGSPIDELSPRSHPDHYAASTEPLAQSFHQNRQVLYAAMSQAGFLRHWGEWWHFCYGDQMWAWLKNLTHPDNPAVAIYGRVTE